MNIRKTTSSQGQRLQVEPLRFASRLAIAAALAFGTTAAQAQTLTSVSDELTPLPGPEILQDAVQLDHNSRAMCVLQDAGNVFCFSKDFGGEALNTALNNDIAAIEMTYAYICGIGKTSGVACIQVDTELESYNRGLQLPPEPNATYISMSALEEFPSNICAIQADNRAVCWGEHEFINNIPAEAQYLKHVDVEGTQACGIDLNDMLICWGEPTIRGDEDILFGDIDPNTIGAAKDISMTFRGACIIDGNDLLQCYGIADNYNALLTDTPISSMEIEQPVRNVLCYETISGVSDCVTYTDNFSDIPTEPISDFPANITPRLFSYYTYGCVISTENEMQCYRNSEPFGIFPLAPTGLRAEVYASDVVELFWDQPRASDELLGRTTGYEIYRDGELINRTQGVVTSYFDIFANSNAVYEVRSTRGNIGSSGTATVALNGNASSTPSNPTPVITPTVPVNTDGDTPAPLLTGQVYSSSAIELSWNRESNSNVRYNIYRDGTLIRQDSPATSQYDPNLMAGTTYVYQVELVLNGNAVSSSSIALTTLNEFGESVSSTPTASEPQGTDAPQGTDTSLELTLTGAVYSTSSVELFWNRADNPTVTYNIFRNGDSVRSGSAAISQFDPGLSANTTYVYEVETVLNNNIVASASIELTTNSQ